MYRYRCNLDRKRGIEKLARAGDYLLIVNRILNARGQAHRFAVVNTRQRQVDSVFGDRERARSTMHSLSRNT